MNNVCFICGVDRLTFDTQAHGFYPHIRNEHNMWQYAFAIIHVREKDPLAYNGWEAYVAAKVDEDDLSFLPANNAISLTHYQERKQRGETRLVDQLGAMEASIAATVEQVSSLAEQGERNSNLLKQLIGGRGAHSRVPDLTPAQVIPAPSNPAPTIPAPVITAPSTANSQAEGPAPAGSKMWPSRKRG